MKKSFNHILFDLDGTIVDPKAGITGSILEVLKVLGRPLPSADELEWCIGPPIRDNFKLILNTTDQALIENAVALYREHYVKIGITGNRVYKGITALLKALAKEPDVHLYIATSKPQIYARMILEHLQMDVLFRNIYGPDLAGNRSEKTELLAYILDQEQISPSQALMIGDRKFDIIGAKANKVKAIGVTYGYGAVDELIAAGADSVCNSALELREILLS